MVGVIALLLAHRDLIEVLSPLDIKANLSHEDRFSSRQIVLHPSANPELFFFAFVKRTRASLFCGSALYTTGLCQKVQFAAVRSIFESMVELSERGELMMKFLDLSRSKMYTYGSQYASLSYCEYISAR